jgi:hypothetical protein
MAETKKAPRLSLNKLTDNVIAPARVRRFLDANGVNREIETELNKVKNTLLQMKKAGGPSRPTPPAPLKKDATELERTKHTEARNKYLAQVKEYNNYVSENFRRMERVHTVCRLLSRLQPLLARETRNASQNREVDELVAMLNDQAVPRRAKETEAEHQARVSKHTPAGLKALTTGTDLRSATATADLLNKLRQENASVSVFLQRDEVAKSRVRFNNAAAVALATVLEAAIEEVVEHGMVNTLESQKKTLQPDHCVSEGVESLSLYTLFRDLPHFRAVEDRQMRREDFEDEQRREKQLAVQKAKTRARKEKKPYKKPDMKQSTFQEHEVANGHALRTETTTQNDKGENVTKVHYEWYGIDVERPELVEDHGVNFNFYVSQICNKVKQNMSSVDKTHGDDYDEIKVSNGIKKFFSDLIVDFIRRLSPLIKLLISAMDVKTVGHEVLKTVLKMLLLSTYSDATQQNGELTEEHQALFNLIDEKVKRLAKAEEVPEEDDLDDLEEEVAPATPVPAPVETPKKGRGRASKQ